MEDLVRKRKNLLLTLLKQIQSFASICIIMVIIVICLLMEKKFKANNKNVNFATWICLGSTIHGYTATEARDVSLNGNVYDFSVEYNSIKKSDILNIHKYLMTKNIIK